MKPLLLVLLLLTAPRPVAAAEPEDLSSKLNASVQDYTLNAGSFLEGLTHLASEFRVPMGIAWINAPAARARLSLHWDHATVKEIIDATARTQAGYRVEASNGVVHVSSARIPPNQNFLLIRIGSFVVRQQVVELAERKLRGLVKEAIVPPEPGPRGIAGSLAVRVGDPKIDVELNDASPQDVLDQLATVSTNKIWVVTFANTHAATAAGFRRTSTLWSRSAVPDDEQPVWDMFGSNEPIPSAGLARSEAKTSY